MEKYINRSKKTKVINFKESDDVQEERSQLVRTEAKNQLQTSGKIIRQQKMESRRKKLVATKSDMSTRKYLKLKTRLIGSFWI